MYFDKMFDFCYELKEIDISNFNTDKIQSMNYMFRQCISLQKLNINNFKCDKTCEMKGVLENCDCLVDLVCSEEIRKRIKK